MDRRKSFSHYEILQVSPQSSDEEIKRAYRRLAMNHHPDRHPRNRKLAELRFRLITEAYAALKTPEKRQQYNLSLRPTAPAPVKQNQNDNSFFGIFADLFRPAQRPEKSRV